MLLDFPLMIHGPASLPLWSNMMITCSGPDVSGIWRYRTQRGLYIVMVGSPRLFPLFCSYFEYLEWKGAYFILWCPGAHWLIFLWLDLAPFQDWVLLQGLEPCTCSLHLTEWDWSLSSPGCLTHMVIASPASKNGLTGKCLDLSWTLCVFLTYIWFA